MGAGGGLGFGARVRVGGGGEEGLGFGSRVGVWVGFGLGVGRQVGWGRVEFCYPSQGFAFSNRR